MRLCIVSETWSPDINGVAHTLSRLSYELRRQGVPVDVIRPRPRTPSHATGVNSELQVQRLALPGYSDVQVGLAG